MNEIVNEQKINKKKKKIWIPIVSIVVIILFAVGIILSIKIKSLYKENTLQEQLDLGEKYLSELNYEQAIAAYEIAIEIEPMSVDAYLGLANAYMNISDYDKVREVLQVGYNLTGDEQLNEDVYLLAVPGKVVEGIYHNPYYKYPLSEEDKNYLCQIINYAEQKDYENALDMIDNDRLLSIVNKFSDGQRYVNAILNDKKIHIFIDLIDENDSYYNSVNLIILPVESGEGYAFSDSVQVNNDGSTYYSRSYGYGKCKEGVFWGEYIFRHIDTGTIFVENEEIAYSNIADGNTMLYNGLYDGEYSLYWSDVDGTNNKKVITYDMGLLKYWNLHEYSPNYTTYMDGYQNDMENIVATGYDEKYVKEWLDTERRSVVYILDGYKEYCEIDGGWQYYLW